MFAAAFWAATRYGRGALVLAVGVFSHFVLDFVTHRPDLPLYPGSPSSVGLGLWNFAAGTLAVECALFVVGVAIYARTTRAINRRGVVALWSLVVLLALFYAMTCFGPPPPSVRLHQVRRPDRLAVRAVGLVDRPEPRDARRPRAGVAPTPASSRRCTDTARRARGAAGGKAARATGVEHVRQRACDLGRAG